MSKTTWLYIKTEPRLWTTGFYRPDGTFEPDEDFGDKGLAARRVHWLNGGKNAELTDHTADHSRLETYIEVILAALSVLLKRSYRPQDQVRMADDKSPFIDHLAQRIDEIIRTREQVRNQKREVA